MSRSVASIDLLVKKWFAQPTSPNHKLGGAGVNGNLRGVGRQNKITDPATCGVSANATVAAPTTTERDARFIIGRARRHVG